MDRHCLVSPAGKRPPGQMNSVPFPHPWLAPGQTPSTHSKDIPQTSDQTDVLVDSRDSGPIPRGLRPCNISPKYIISDLLEKRRQTPAPRRIKANEPRGVSSQNEIVEGSGGFMRRLLS